MDHLGEDIVRAFHSGDELTPSQIVDHCHGVYPPTAVKSMILELILSDVLELTPDRTVRLKGAA